MHYDLKLKNVILNASAHAANDEEFTANIKISLVKGEDGAVKSVKVNSVECAVESASATAITADAKALEIAFAAKTTNGVSAQGVVKARLPGQMLSVKVKAGDKVSQGDLLGVLDAMKMENDILAPVGGIVKSVEVDAGESVKKNQTLFVLASALGE